jgi:hypothetical protein
LSEAQLCLAGQTGWQALEVGAEKNKKSEFLTFWSEVMVKLVEKVYILA